MRAEWRFVSEDSGVHYVMIHGTTMMLRWCAGNLGLEQQVNARWLYNMCVYVDVVFSHQEYMTHQGRPRDI